MEANIERYYVWPFIKVDNFNWSLPDVVLAQTWEDLIIRNRAQSLFWSGKINCLMDFIDWLKNESNVIIFIFDNVKKDFCFFSWTNAHFPPGGALIHYSAIGPYRHGAAKTVLNWWKNQCYPDSNEQVLKLLIGFTPATNKATVKLMKNLGFQTLTIPNLCQLAMSGDIVPGVLGVLNLQEMNPWATAKVAVAA